MVWLHSTCFHLENRFSSIILSNLEIDHSVKLEISVQIGIEGMPDNVMACLSALKLITVSGLLIKNWQVESTVVSISPICLMKYHSLWMNNV